MKKFEINETYKMTFIGDSELIVPVKIIKRTEKTAIIQIRKADQKRVKIYNFDNCEFILPEGRYSMAPSCYANKEYYN